MGIGILPPDVNESDHEFVVVGGNIRFGLDAVKGVGHVAVEAIKRARAERGRFESLWDFCERVDARTVNKRAIEALIKCGAFDSTRASRKGMLQVLERAQGAGQKTQEDALIGQGSIFDLGGAAEPSANGRARGPFAPSPQLSRCQARSGTSARSVRTRRCRRPTQTAWSARTPTTYPRPRSSTALRNP